MPAQWDEIQHICTKCKGTGMVDPPHNQDENPAPVQCPICLGEGYLEWGRKKVNP